MRNILRLRKFSNLTPSKPENSISIAFPWGDWLLWGMLGRVLKYWLPVVLWMTVIFGASTSLGTSQHTSRFVVPILKWLAPGMSEDSINTIHYYVRKTAHFSEYAFLGILLIRAIRSEPKLMANRTLQRQLLLGVLLCALFAASDEFHQLFVSDREARVTDVLIDTTGSSCGLLLFWGVLRLRKRV